MWKTGWKILGGTLVIACIWCWYVEIYTPRRLIEKAVEATAKYSKPCDAEDQWGDLDAKPSFMVASKDGLTCRRTTFGDGQIDICHKPIVAAKPQADKASLKSNQLKVRFQSRKQSIDTRSIVDFGGSTMVSSNRDVALAFSNTHIFVGWIRQEDAAPQEAITLRMIDIRSGNQRLEKGIYRAACCLVNLALHYDPKHAKLLLAWNDWSLPDDRNLFFGELDVNQLLRDNQQFAPKQVAFKDKWDKRNPYFLRDNDKIYLIYTTGDHWGWLSYSGRQSIGVYTMDETHQPAGYYLVAAIRPLGKVLKIENGYLWYELLSQDASRIEEIRKISLNKALKVL
jgi:hypothetical protein